MNRYFRKADDIEGYSYDDDIHCVPCAEADGMDVEGAVDGAGIEPFVIFIGHESESPLHCGRCHEYLETTHLFDYDGNPVDWSKDFVPAVWQGPDLADF